MWMPDRYTLRPARPSDLPRLPLIEAAAAIHFLATPYAFIVEDSAANPVSANVDLAHEHVWVAADLADQPVGFAILRLLATSVHLHELDVHPQHAGQGLGRRLIEAAAAWARAQGASALTLTTFGDVPWNGPYYARLGFRTLDLATLAPALLEVRQEEANAGLPMAQRVCMQLDL
jgi:GNAT superfamily N-acetyltransferase